MPEKASIIQIAQIGVESTHGTGVAANKQLASMMLKPKPMGNVKPFRASGNVAPTVMATGKRWSEIDVTGEATYTELIYPLSSILKTAAITTPGGGTLSRLWTFTPANTGNDTYASYTVEYGSGAADLKATNGTFVDFSVDITRDDGGAIKGKMVAGQITNAITMTASPTALDLVPVVGDDWDLFLDSTFGGIGTTRLDRALSASFAITGRKAPLWTLDSTQSSFAAFVETEPKWELKLRYMKNTTSDALYATLDANDTRYLRALATGPIIEGALPYKFGIDAPVKVTAIPALDDFENVYAYDFTFSCVIDQTAAKFLTVTVQNKQTAL